MSASRNQRERILDLLQSAHGGEVPSVSLSKISLQYGARVKELRELGFNITNRTERKLGQVHGFFKLELEPQPTMTNREHCIPLSIGSVSSFFPEFGPLTPERYPD